MLATVFEAQRDRWDNVSELLKVLIEVTDRNGLWFFDAHREKDTKRPDPVEIKRPSAEAPEQERRMATAAEMKKWFGGAVEYTP